MYPTQRIFQSYLIALFKIFSAPEESPSSVTCTAVSSTSLRVWWQSIETQNHGGALTGFTILYSAEGIF